MQYSTLLYTVLATGVAARSTTVRQQVPLNDDGGVQKSLELGDDETLILVRNALRKAEVIPTVLDDFLPTFLLSVHWPNTTNAALGNTLNVSDLQVKPTLALSRPTPDLVVEDNNDRDLPTASDKHHKTHHQTSHYVFTLTDPDAPSRENPEWSEMCHWIAELSLYVYPSVEKAGAVNTPISVPEAGFTTDAALSTVKTSEAPTEDTSKHHKKSKKHKKDKKKHHKDGKKKKHHSKKPYSPHLKDIVAYKPPGPPPKTGKHRYVFTAWVPLNGTTGRLHLSKPKEREHWGVGRVGGGVRDWARGNGLVAVGANFIYAEHEE